MDRQDSDITNVVELEDLGEKEEKDGIQKGKNGRLQYLTSAVSFAEDVTERRYEILCDFYLLYYINIFIPALLDDQLTLFLSHQIVLTLMIAEVIERN